MSVVLGCNVKEPVLPHRAIKLPSTFLIMITLTVMQKEELSIFVKIIDATICYAEKV